VSDNRACPLVSAVRGGRLESPSGVDACRSWAGRPGRLGGRPYGQAVDTAGAGRPSMHPGVSCSASVDGCGHGRHWTPVAVMDVAVRRGVRSGHRRPDARPHHGSVAHSGNHGRPAGQRRRTRAWKARRAPPCSRDAAGLAQVRDSPTGPLLTVRDRQEPMLRARGGHGEGPWPYFAAPGGSSAEG
jgi:hypothetical protein